MQESQKKEIEAICQKCQTYFSYVFDDEMEQAEEILEEIKAVVDYEMLILMKSIIKVGETYKDTMYTREIRPVFDFDAILEQTREETKHISYEELLNSFLFSTSSTKTKIGLYYM